MKVTTVADMSKISVDKITTSIMGMSNQTGISTGELNEALYQTISAGVDTAHSVEFLADATKLSEAGFAEIGSTIDVKLCVA